MAGPGSSTQGSSALERYSATFSNVRAAHSCFAADAGRTVHSTETPDGSVQEAPAADVTSPVQWPLPVEYTGPETTAAPVSRSTMVAPSRPLAGLLRDSTQATLPGSSTVAAPAGSSDLATATGSQALVSWTA